MPSSLLTSRRFLPLFLTQALGALNDNLFKNAMVILVVFQLGAGGAGMAAAAGGVFILPFALFSAAAGQLADGHDKARLIRLSKAAELALMALAAAALLTGSIPALMAVLFGLGAQATMFGPLKYGILPQHLAPAELLPGNALIEAATFAAILARHHPGRPPDRRPARPGHRRRRRPRHRRFRPCDRMLRPRRPARRARPARRLERGGRNRRHPRHRPRAARRVARHPGHLVVLGPGRHLPRRLPRPGA